MRNRSRTRKTSARPGSARRHNYLRWGTKSQHAPSYNSPGAINASDDVIGFSTAATMMMIALELIERRTDKLELFCRKEGSFREQNRNSLGVIHQCRPTCVLPIPGNKKKPVFHHHWHHCSCLFSFAREINRRRVYTDIMKVSPPRDVSLSLFSLFLLQHSERSVSIKTHATPFNLREHRIFISVFHLICEIRSK